MCFNLWRAYMLQDAVTRCNSKKLWLYRWGMQCCDKIAEKCCELSFCNCCVVDSAIFSTINKMQMFLKILSNMLLYNSICNKLFYLKIVIRYIYLQYKTTKESYFSFWDSRPYYLILTSWRWMVEINILRIT